MKKNIAVAGCGHWGKNLVRNFYDLNALYAIYDSDPTQLDLFKKKYPDLILHQSFSSLLEDSKVNAVVISTPAATHYSLAKEALLSNRDVMVEKPIALKFEQGEELVTIANEKSRILMVGHILLYHPAIRKLKEMIASGMLGKINYIYSNRLNLGKFRTEENILWSFAPHDISVIVHLLNEVPESVSASGGSYLNPDILDVTISNLNFSSGVRAHIFVSWLHPYKEQKLIIVGSKKMALFDDVNPKDKLFIYDVDIDWIDRAPIPRQEKARPIEIEDSEPLRSECEHFIKCVQTRRGPLTDGEEGLRVLSILEACQRSLEKRGKTVDLEKRADTKNLYKYCSKIDETY